ncbi:uncharacterized protein [Macrobrachium rosenbergii]|uniref:uncharacterized protein n=1 Tax=Macrobrachium rosenbergii TaxID=79674 RepID=UPI0034D68C77
MRKHRPADIPGCDELVKSETTVINYLSTRDSRSLGKVPPDIEKSDECTCNTPASLMARCTAEDWKYQMPWVLLGLRTAPRADGAPSAAEKTYHNPSVQRLCDVVSKFAPCKRTYTNRSATFTPPGLASTTHVFIRDDAICPPLTKPYRGPFRVLERNNKAFLLALSGRNDWVSINRVKPALLEEDTDVTAVQPLPGHTSPQAAGARPPPKKLTLTHSRAASHTECSPIALTQPWHPSAPQQIHHTFEWLRNVVTTEMCGRSCVGG